MLRAEPYRASIFAGVISGIAVTIVFGADDTETEPANGIPEPRQDIPRRYFRKTARIPRHCSCILRRFLPLLRERQEFVQPQCSSCMRRASGGIDAITSERLSVPFMTLVSICFWPASSLSPKMPSNASARALAMMPSIAALHCAVLAGMSPVSRQRHQGCHHRGRHRVAGD